MTNIKLFIIRIYLHLLKWFRALLSQSETTYKILFMPGYEESRFRIGNWRAWRAFERARKETPAYKKFLGAHENIRIGVKGLDVDLSSVPIMDKESYIKKYSIEERCLGGAIPTSGVVIDESSGTSGTANNWVRGKEERAAVKFALQTAIHYLIGDQPIFFINAFALGPWATGMNVSMSVVDIAILKSVGPDAHKVINTLKFFGPKYNYIISGYPPFLKGLVDSTEINWSEYNIIAFYGGEGISEPARDYLLRAFKKVYGSYGASDLEINISAENDFTIRLRRAIIANEKLAKALVRHTGVPMIFQYNPFDYYIETNEEGKLVVTLCRPTNVQPKIRYNIHDLGHVVRVPELKKILRSVGMSIEEIGELPSDLPLLFHYGRSDMAVAFYGCKITPGEIENIIFSSKELAPYISSFSLVTSEDSQLNKKLELALELQEGKTLVLSEEVVTKMIFDALKEANQDFRESSRMIPAGNEPHVKLYAFGTGPFTGGDIRLKKKYIQKA